MPTRFLSLIICSGTQYIAQITSREPSYACLQKTECQSVLVSSAATVRSLFLWDQNVSYRSLFYGVLVSYFVEGYLQMSSQVKDMNAHINFATQRSS